MLQIGQKPTEKEQTKPELSVRGRQLSLDELFRSQSKFASTKSGFVSCGSTFTTESGQKLLVVVVTYY